MGGGGGGGGEIGVSPRPQIHSWPARMHIGCGFSMK